MNPELRTPPLPATHVRAGTGIRALTLSADWAPRPDEGDKVLFIFEGGTLTADQLSAITFRDGEVAEWAFIEDKQLDELTIPRLARRLRATMQARRQALPAYLEEGGVPTTA